MDFLILFAANLSAQDISLISSIVEVAINAILVAATIISAIFVISKLGIVKKLSMVFGRTFIREATLDDLDGDGPIRRAILNDGIQMETLKEINRRTMRIELSQRMESDFGKGAQKETILNLLTEYRKAGGNHYIDEMIEEYLNSLSCE